MPMYGRSFSSEVLHGRVGKQTQSPVGRTLYACRTILEFTGKVLAILDQYKSDMEAIRHELEAVWEAINELQGIDPAKVGEPDGNGRQD